MLFSVVAAVYAPSIQNDFIYDDHLLIVEQRVPQRSTDFLQIFAERHLHNLPYYRPVSRLTMVVQKYFHGNDPLPYHLFNAALMGLAAVLTFAMLRSPRFEIRYMPALLGAALLTLHPIASLCVYPISGRETLLSAVFVITAVVCFLRAGQGWYLLAIAMFALALLSKEQAIVVPGLFVLADVLGLSAAAPGRNVRRWAWRYLPLLVVLAAYGLIRWKVLEGGGEYRIALFNHPMGPVYSLLFSLQTMIVPYVELKYEPRIDVWFSLWRQGLSFVAVLLVGAAALAHRRTIRTRVMFWLAWSVLAMLPTANLLEQEAHFAERYGFLTLLGVIGLVATVVSSAWTAAHVRRWTCSIAVVLCIACAAISVHRGRYFKNDIAFARQWVRSDPLSAHAACNLGTSLGAAGKMEQAIPYFRQTLQIRPDHAEAHHGLGIALQSMNMTNQAIEHYQKALAIKPEMYNAHCSLALALQSQGQIESAIERHLISLQINPDYAPAHNNLGSAYRRQGDLVSAMKHFRQAVRVQPEYALAHYNLGITLKLSGRSSESIIHFQRATRFDPCGVPPLRELAWLLATHPDDQVQDANKAVQLAQRADELTGHRAPSVLDVLAAAHAATGQFERAAATARLAVELASATDNHDLARRIRNRLRLYEQSKPYRESSAASGSAP